MKSASRPALSTVSRLLAFAAFAAALPLVPSASFASTYYWDTNGSTTGSGAATGTWDSGTTALWTTDSTGGTATSAVTTTTADDLIFSAGTTGTTGTVTVSGTQSANSITFDDNVALTISGGTSIALGTTGSSTAGITVASGDNAANTISTAIALGVNSTVINNGTGTLTLSGIISGTGFSLTKTGTGTLTLQGVNTFNGGLVIKEGTVIGALAGSNNNAMFGTGTITIGDSVVGANATLNEAGFGNNISNAITVASGAGTRSLIGSSNNAGQIPIFTGLITLNNNLTIGTTNVANIRISGGITGSGNITVNNTSSGAVDFRTAAVNNTGTITNSSTGSGGVSQGTAVSFGANVTSLIQNSTTSVWNVSQPNGNFVGTAQVLAGTMAVTNTSGLNVNNAVSVASGATFDVRDVSLTIAGLNDVSSAGGTVTDTTGTAVRTLTLGGSGTYSYSGTITATTPANMAITKSGTGTQTLSGTNTYTGATNITGGTLKLGSTGALSTSAVTVNGGTLDFNGNSISNTLSVSGSGSGSNGALVNSNTGTAAILSSEITNGASLTVGGAGDMTLQRVRSGGSVITLTKVGTGALTLGNASTTTHMNLLAVDVQSASTVNFNTASGTNYLVADRGVRVASGGTVNYTGTGTNMVGDNQEVIVSNGTFNLNGISDTVGRITIGDGTNNGTISGGSSSTLTVGGSYQAFAAGGSTLTGGIEAMSGTVNVKLAGAAALTKTTSGTVTLSQANTYTGVTTITAGTLAMGVNNAFGATNFALNGGTLAIGTFSNSTVGTLSLTAVSSTITVGSGGVFAFANSSGIDWLSNTLSITGTFVDGTSIRFGTDGTGLTSTQLGLITINGSSAAIDANGFLTVSAVPEPATYAVLAGLGVLGLAACRRRRV